MSKATKYVKTFSYSRDDLTGFGGGLGFDREIFLRQPHPHPERRP